MSRSVQFSDRAVESFETLAPSGAVVAAVRQAGQGRLSHVGQLVVDPILSASSAGASDGLTPSKIPVSNWLSKSCSVVDSAPEPLSSGSAVDFVKQRRRPLNNSFDSIGIVAVRSPQ